MSAEQTARNARIIALRREGVGPREIARRLKVTANVVSGVLTRAGLTKPTGGRGNGATAGFKALVLGSKASPSNIQTAASWGIHESTFYMWRRQAASQ